MDLQEFKKQYVQIELGITSDFGRIFTFIDFGNVNHWFEEDKQTYEYVALADDEKLVVDLEKLHEFVQLFSDSERFYYGYDPQNAGSFGFIRATREIFGKNKVFTKHIQKIRHYLNEIDTLNNTRNIYTDRKGIFVYIPKCNFDVEISVDAIKLLDHYDTFCLFSGDADFVHLARFLKGKGKKVILIKGGNITHQLKEVCNFVINAQDIKKYISVVKKQKPGIKPGLADRKPESSGRTILEGS
ncbi:MAG: NYN domain-containing protein [Candidatus Paceibacterota bacterium]